MYTRPAHRCSPSTSITTSHNSRRIGAALAGITTVLLISSLVGCGLGGDSAGAAVIDPGDGGNYHPAIDSATFVRRIDNPYLPFLPGATWVYASDDGKERIEVTVLEETRIVMGITATVVRDVVTVDGIVAEDTLDWYAQDADGNVWCLGEATREFADGKVDTAGSWEAGVDGALPGIIMLAKPEAGRAYRQEFYRDEAEDMRRVVRLAEREVVAGKSYDGVVVIEEWTPLEPDVVEHKFYARGVGTVFEEHIKGGESRLMLVSFTPGR